MNTKTVQAGVPDQTGRTAIITGGSSGVGLATAAALATRGAHVILAVRNQERGRAVAAELPGDVEVRGLDLGSMASVRDFAAGIEGPIDLLINNAGTMTAALQHTADGFERQLAVNHLGHFALTNLLLEQITGRVVGLSSSVHHKAHIGFDDLQWEQRPYRPLGAYGQSKLAVLLFIAELQRRLTASGSPVIATAADPGWVSTGFRITTGSRTRDAAIALGTRLFAQGPTSGARPTLYAAVGDVPGGSYAGPSRFGIRGPATLIDPSSDAVDADLAGRVWEVSARLTNTQ
ncbi:oxidoreductase [Nocardia fusca]|uniref:oxidoreductase n=1 Tax=Nocardia fusca TaxID=941183 RepID=UPI0037C700C0